MARCDISGRSAKVLVLALVLLSTAFICLVSLGPGDQPELKAITMQTWPSGTIVVNVTDDFGRPVAGATVKTVGDGISWQNQTASNGTLVLVNVTGGEVGSPVAYSMNASAAGYRDSNPVNIDLFENETIYIDLVVYGGSILGTVTTTSGLSPGPVAGATVTISALGYSADVLPTNGYYQISGIPAGTHSVTANASGYVPSSQDVVVPLGGSVLLNFVLISQNGSISGFVYHATLLTPLNSTNVSIQIGLFSITVLSGSDGSYNLTNIPEGTYTVTASKDGFFSGNIPDVEVTRGNRTENKDFYLIERPTRLYGVVRSGTLLIVGANISIVGTEIFNKSGPDGSYEIRNLTAGTYTVLATSAGYQPMTFYNVVILPGGETQLSVNFTGLPGAILRGVVRDVGTGEVLAKVLVTIVNLDQPRSTETNINGEFEFPGLEAGNYTVRFERTGYRPVEVERIVVLDDQTTQRDFELTPLRKGFEGFIFGFDMAHSMMILALFLTIVILAMAVYLRIRTFQAPESAPAVYDQVEEEEAEKKVEAELEKSAGEKGDLNPDLPEAPRKQ